MISRRFSQISSQMFAEKQQRIAALQFRLGALKSFHAKISKPHACESDSLSTVSINESTNR